MPHFERVAQENPDFSSRSLGHSSNDEQGGFNTKLGEATHPQGPWGINWRSPTKMIALFLGGTVCALGHHLYYANLDNTVVVNITSRWNLEAVRDSQEWKIRFGTGFAFLTKTMFAAAVAIAYQQRLWVTTRKQTVTINGLDAMFSAANNIFSFANLEFLRRAKLGAALALLVWLIPLSALVTPATLTVIPATKSNSSIMHVPSVNFSQISPLFDYQSSVVGADVTSTNDGITPYMSRLVSSTATTFQVLAMNQVIANSTYSVKFNGPSFSCHIPSDAVDEAIFMALNATTYVASGRQMNNRFDTEMAWLAFPPTSQLMSAMSRSNDTNPLSDDWLMFLKFAATCLTEAAMWGSAFDSIPLCEGIIIPPGGSNSLTNVSSIYDDADYYNYGRIWVWAQNATYDCILTDTEYDVAFSYSLSENTQRVDPHYEFRWTGNDLYGSYFPIADAVANLLGGSVRGLFTGITSYKTRVSETAIFGALKADTSSQYATNSGLSPGILTFDIKDLAHNKSVGQLIEELSRNVTLSLFSADKILSLDNTTTTVTTTANVNVYSYNRPNLILTYAITFALALLGLIAGCVAYLQNGVSYDNSFSAFMLTTRNKRLDELAKGRSMGAMPLENEVKKTELRFGLLQGDKDGVNNEGSRRVGFGFRNQVTPLQKGIPYY
ncbi:hypothetical protein SUNI508_13095 [Seiridium unicorne]|uniref:Uncharacterized protein n=1 Tax=Seiridium unicorne TaxID=138068 RepID=A0ABR2VEM5_9PEZI